MSSKDPQKKSCVKHCNGIHIRDTLIFETLLYPIFEKETLTKVPSARAYKNHKVDYIDYLGILIGPASQIIEAIYQYLRNCCSEIYEYS